MNKISSSLEPIFYGIISANCLFLFITLCIFIAILIILIRTVRVRCRSAAKKLKTAQKVVRDHLSPSVEDFLILTAQVGLTEEKVKEIYTAYDSRRRKVAEKQLKYGNEIINKFEIFKAFMSESNFIKGSGFRMHRLLHEGRIQEFTDDDEGLTILAPSFQPIKTPLKKIDTKDVDVPPKVKSVAFGNQTKGKVAVAEVQYLSLRPKNSPKKN